MFLRMIFIHLGKELHLSQASWDSTVRHGCFEQPATSIAVWKQHQQAKGSNPTSLNGDTFQNSTKYVQYNLYHCHDTFINVFAVSCQ